MPLPGVKRGSTEKLKTVSARLTESQLQLLTKYSEFMKRERAALMGELIAYAIGKDADFAKEVEVATPSGSKPKVA